MNRRAISSGVILAMCRLMSSLLRVSGLAMVSLTPLSIRCANDTRLLARPSIG